MKPLLSTLALLSFAAWAQSEPPPPPVLPLETPPPLSVSCTSARDCPQVSDVCELTSGPASRGVCTPGPSDARFCTTDASCKAGHCGQHKLTLNFRETRWLGVCLAGPRVPAHGPAPLATNAPLPLRFEYAGTVPPGYVLQERPDMKLLVPGLIVFPLSYAVSQMWLVFLHWNAWSLVPLAGPLTQFFIERGDVDARSQGEFNLALLGTVGQTLGLTAIIVGLAKPTRWLERSTVTVVPTPGGAALLGAF